MTSLSVPDTPIAEKGLGLQLYRQMLLLRIFELRAGELCRKGEMPSFLHLYVGEEAVAVGVCSLLEPGDIITSTHRGHGHALAKGLEPRRLMAELYGRADGICGGRGGSMHLFAPEIGLLGTNGFVGGGIPSAAGAALTAKLRRTGRVAVAFFGDGAVNHATFHESMNIAAAWNLPMLFVCENNLYATATPFVTATRNTDIASRAAAYAMPGEEVDGQDVWAVRAAAQRAIRRAQNGEGPTLLACQTYRFVGHHEGDPLVGTYRTQEELDRWKQRCPLVLMERFLIERAACTEAELEQIPQEVGAVVEDAIEFARASPWPESSTVEAHLFCKGEA
jgi:2-oxoisovalerate dehydrogenase E1 component